MTASDVFLRITAALSDCGIPYMISGSFASAYYGAPRSTQDIDIVIDPVPEQLQAFVQSLSGKEYFAEMDAARQAYAHRSLFNVIDLATGWKIDLIIRKERPFSKEEFRRRRQVRLHDLQLYIATVEDLIIAKLEWSKLGQSQRQIEDVAGILRLRQDSLDYPYLGKWTAELQLEQQWASARAMLSDSTP